MYDRLIAVGCHAKLGIVTSGCGRGRILRRQGRRSASSAGAVDDYGAAYVLPGMIDGQTHAGSRYPVRIGPDDDGGGGGGGGHHDRRHAL